MSSEGADAMSDENEEKSALVPRLRFPEFREAAGWKAAQLDKLISTVTPPKKIPSTEYLAEGQFPIIDQGQSDIAGWTNDPDSLVTENEPLIIFGDHTCALKLTRSSFAQGADGIKILKGNGPATTEFLYQHLCFRPVSPEEYKRHFSILRNKVIAYPETRSDEQQKIADCLSSLDDLITAETQKLDALKTHKKGLMQQLFPREGETVPRLQFPEFQEAGEWDEKRLGEVGNVRMCKRILKEQTSPCGDIPFYKIGTFGGVPDAYISRDIFEGFKNSYPFPKNGAVLISAAGTIGRTVRYNGELAYFQDSNIVWLENDETIIADNFLLYIYQLINWAPSVGAIQRLYNENILGTQVKFPRSIPEQQRIADCLTSLDDLITAQSQKIDALNIHKKGLMQQLFPVLDEVPA